MCTIETEPNTTKLGKNINDATVIADCGDGSCLLMYKDTNVSTIVEFHGSEILSDNDEKVCNYDEYIFNRSRDEIIDMILNSQPTPGFNRMGCSESWYDAFYAVSKTFTEEYIRTRSELELKALLALGATISAYLY